MRTAERNSGVLRPMRDDRGMAQHTDSHRPRSRGPNRVGIERRKQILDAAWEVFGQRGYTTTSLRMIAEAVNLTPAGVLRHFGRKEELLTAVLTRFDDIDRFSVENGGRRFGLEYFAGLRQLMETHSEHPGLIELLLTMSTEGANPAHPAHSWVVARYDRIVAEAVRAFEEAVAVGEIPPMDPETMEREGRVVFAIMDGLELQWLLDPTLDLGRLFGPVYEHLLTRWKAGCSEAGAL